MLLNVRAGNMQDLCAHVCVFTPYGLRVGREHEHSDEGEAERRVIVLPDHCGDQ